MPREAVYGSERPYGTSEGTDWVPVNPVVEVTWSREAGHIQIATCSYDGVLGGKLHEVPKEIIAAGYVQPGEEEAWLDRNQGMYVSLDREGINKLIRNLRRARDQAFGRDE